VSTLERVKIIVANQLDIDPSDLTETTELQEVGFESLDVIEVIFSLEDAFQVDIPFNANDNDPSEMKTVGDIVRMVEVILAGKSPDPGAAPADGEPTDGRPE
jgi:acyl carrier protein